MRRLPVLAAAAAVAVALAGCGADDADQDAAEGASPERPPATTEQVSAARPEVEPFDPDAAEEYANGKRLAGRIAQDALTYRRGASAREVAAALPAGTVSERELARVLRPAVDPEMRSSAEVVYPQLSGVSGTSLGAMVVVRQTLEDADGRRASVTRVLDVRLRRSGGPWALDRIAAVGGAPAERPGSLPEAAERVLDHPNIELPDSARWDIYRGEVDASLLSALARAADDHELSVAVLKSGHPPNVWATDRPSAHSRGFAADIYAVDGRLVIRQRRNGSAAYELAQSLFAGGARQLGSPWSFGGGARSFSDAVHQDHIHVQQAAVGGITDSP